MMINWFSGVAGQGAATLAGIVMGVCQLPAEDTMQQAAMSGSVCFDARIAEDIAWQPKSGAGLFKIASGYASLGIHFSPMFAVQSSGSIRGVSRFNGTESGWNLLPESPSGIDRRHDHTVVRIGSPGQHRLRSTIGVQRLPFGIDMNPGDDLWQLTEDRIFWGQTLKSAVITVDNQVDFQADIGFGRGSPWDENDLEETSLRMMYDLSFFERARLIVSAAGTAKDPRYAFGFLTTSRQGDLTQFEIIRTTSPDADLDVGYRRFFRFAFATGDRRFWFLYDEDRLRTQTFAVGYRHFFDVGTVEDWTPLAVRLSVGRVRSFSSGIDSSLAVTSGVEANF